MKKSPIAHSITVNGKKYEYQLLPKSRGKVTRIICPTANIDQDFLNEDVPALLTDLPHLIITEKKYRQKQDITIRFRVTTQEKSVIEQNAIKKGFQNVSGFLRERALSKH